MPHRSVALIPAYKPDERALEVARSLNDLGFYRMSQVIGKVLKKALEDKE